MIEYVASISYMRLLLVLKCHTFPFIFHRCNKVLVDVSILHKRYFRDNISMWWLRGWSPTPRFIYWLGIHMTYWTFNVGFWRRLWLFYPSSLSSHFVAYMLCICYCLTGKLLCFLFFENIKESLAPHIQTLVNGPVKLDATRDNIYTLFVRFNSLPDQMNLAINNLNRYNQTLSTSVQSVSVIYAHTKTFHLIFIYLLIHIRTKIYLEKTYLFDLVAILTWRKTISLTVQTTLTE